jgi:hypothetical protein
MENIVVEWNPDMMIEVELKDSDSFLQIKETLTRIGIANFKKKILTQSCHILRKKGKYYIVSFKELFALDGRVDSITTEDLARRNRITKLLEDWGLLKIISDCPVEEGKDRVKVFVLKYSEKNDWNLVSKYTIGDSNV